MKKLAVYLLSVVLLAGCAGKTPHPVQIYRPTDDTLTCEQINYELQQNQSEMFRLYPKTEKMGKNVALGVAGAFLLVPWFFMDFSDAEQVEIEAFQRRDQHLHLLASNKGCQGMPPAIQLQKEAP